MSGEQIHAEELGKAVDNLAIGLGMWISTAWRAGTEVHEAQVICYIESLMLLAKESGLGATRYTIPIVGILTFAEHIPKGETLLTMTPEQVRQFETETITFGKHAGQRYGDVPREYLEWLADQAVRLQSYLRATQ